MLNFPEPAALATALRMRGISIDGELRAAFTRYEAALARLAALRMSPVDRAMCADAGDNRNANEAAASAHAESAILRAAINAVPGGGLR